MCDTSDSPRFKAQTPGAHMDEDVSSTLSPAVPFSGPPDHSPKRRIWSAAEDEQLVSLVDEHGDLRWSQIAEKMFKRNHKQCRERWHNHLRPNLNKGDFTEKEDSDLVACVQQVGTCWAKIASMIMPDRTDNDLKNRWNSLIRKPSHPRGRPWDQAEIAHREAVFSKPKQSRRRPEPATQIKRSRLLKVSPPSSDSASDFSSVTICLQGESQWWPGVQGCGARREERRENDWCGVGTGKQVDHIIGKVLLPALHLEADESDMPDIEVEADADRVFSDLLTDEELDPADDNFPTELGLPACSMQQPMFGERSPLRELHAAHLFVREFLGTMRSSATISPRMAKADAEALIRQGYMEEDATLGMDMEADPRPGSEHNAENVGRMDGYGRNARDIFRRDRFAVDAIDL